MLSHFVCQNGADTAIKTTTMEGSFGETYVCVINTHIYGETVAILARIEAYSRNILSTNRTENIIP